MSTDNLNDPPDYLRRRLGMAENAAAEAMCFAYELLARLEDIEARLFALRSEYREPSPE